MPQLCVPQYWVRPAHSDVGLDNECTNLSSGNVPAHPCQGKDRNTEGYAKDWQKAPPGLWMPAVFSSSRVGSRQLCDHMLRATGSVLLSASRTVAAEMRYALPVCLSPVAARLSVATRL